MTAIGATMIRQRSVNMIGAGGRRDQEALAWQAAVIANGGTVSAGRLAIVTSFIAAEKSAGTWALTDDYWGLWAENAPQALTSLKQRRLATAVAAPTFTMDRGYAFDGLAQYITTGFIPATHAVAMTLTSARIAVYERTDVSVTSLYSMGVTHTGDNRLLINPRRGTTGRTQISILSPTLVGDLIADSLGLTAASLSAGTWAQYKRGVPGVVTPLAAVPTALPGLAVFLGAANSNGAPGLFRAASVGMACLGAALTPAQETAQYTNVQAWATAVGANV